MNSQLPSCGYVDHKKIIVSLEAIINLLDRKGIISKRELMEEMKRVQASMTKGEK